MKLREVITGILVLGVVVLHLMMSYTKIVEKLIDPSPVKECK